MTVDLRAELDHVIDHAITDQPRSQQTRIGPSEIGNPCDRCLGHKLAGTAQLPEVEPPWLPYVGTAMHTELSEVFTRATLADSLAGGDGRWMTECQVDVGEINGTTITGHCDLYDTATFTTVDWKLVGANTLKHAKIRPSAVYRVQAHLYGRGWVRAGRRVDRVAIYYLPRNSMLRRNGIFWSEPYDEAVAVAALTRADAFAKALVAMGPDRFLPKLSRLPGCFDCSRYAMYPGDLPINGAGEPRTLDDLMSVA